jgi:adenine-specific DNA-methyltransferase
VEAILNVAEPSRQKSLGAYYTPSAIARAIVDWAVRDAGDHVLDPSFGGLAFLREAHQRLSELGTGTAAQSLQLHGCDIDPAAHEAALRELELPVDAARLAHGDFLTLLPDQRLPRCQAVIGNPPYVRYQLSDAVAGQRAAENAGLSISRLSSIWAPFVAHSVQFVALGGRLGYVLPAELIHAQYASRVLDFLCDRFGSVSVAMFERRVFPGALEEVVLLLADDAGARCREPDVISYRDLDDLIARGLPATARESRPSTQQKVSARTAHDKLLSRLLPVETRELLGQLVVDDRVRRLGELASVDIGAVTGANKLFLLTDEQARADGIAPELLRHAVSKAVHIPGVTLTAEDVATLRAKGAPVLLLALGREASEEQLATVEKTLARGLRDGVDQRYKCRVRDPWWSVPIPGSGPPDLLLTYCAAEHPRLTLNAASALHTNTLHGVRRFDGVDAGALATTFINSLTLLSAELVGRSYGGGVLKLEPTEAEAVLVPPLVTDQQLLKVIDARVRARDLAGALERADRVVLGEGLGLDERHIGLLRDGAEHLRARRRARGKS